LEHLPGGPAGHAPGPLESLAVEPDLVLLDARRLPDLPCPRRPTFEATPASTASACASIVAKVGRDRMMDRVRPALPRVRLRPSQGIPDPGSSPGAGAFGPSPIHRRSFRGVAEQLGLF